MRICLVSNGSLVDDPRALAEAEALRSAGHDVFGAAAEEAGGWIAGPHDPGLIDRLARRTKEQLIAKRAAAHEADIYQPAHPGANEMVAEAAATNPGASVLVKPGWPRPSAQDLIELAPFEVERSVPASGLLPAMHVPGAIPPSATSRSGSVVVAYRKSERNPGRYLEAALDRAGLDVVHTEVLDWAALDGSTRAVVIVESPLPALEVRGTNPGVPVVFWVHHGEHHVDANIRLQRFYGAQAVLLAHSWHLTHRFTGLVDRLPFAVAPELFPSEFRAHTDRRWDVGFVGARSGDESRYSRRESILAELEHELGEDRVATRSNVTPNELAALYRDSRVVIDDGLGRHLPITMRAFEATGAGALLFTNPGPGMSLLMAPDHDYLQLGDDIEPVVRSIRADTETVARSGHHNAWENHTYDRRAAQLLAVIDRIEDEEVAPPIPRPVPDGLAAVVERFPDAQRVIDLGADLTGMLPDREVWDYERSEERAEPGTFHVAAIAGGSSEHRARAIAAARIAVVTPPEEANRVSDEVRKVHGEVTRHDFRDGSAFSFGSAGYRASPNPEL